MEFLRMKSKSILYFSHYQEHWDRFQIFILIGQRTSQRPNLIGCKKTRYLTSQLEFFRRVWSCWDFETMFFNSFRAGCLYRDISDIVNSTPSVNICRQSKYEFSCSFPKIVKTVFPNSASTCVCLMKRFITPKIASSMASFWRNWFSLLKNPTRHLITVVRVALVFIFINSLII